MGIGASAYTPPQVPDKVYSAEYVSSLPSMSGKVVAVTGATTTNGLGYICAKTLATKGARIILLNRLSDRAKVAETSLRQEVPGAQVSTVECDLMSFDSVNKAAATLRSELKDTGLDVLCNNAGVMALPDEATKDGYDVQMQTNHLSHFLLSKELYPLLEKAAEARGEARIVNHSSGVSDDNDFLLFIHFVFLSACEEM